MEYRLANGSVITDGDIERECAEYESGSWEGSLVNLRVGRPRLSEVEANANLSFKCPKTGADLIERAAAACGMRKSEFLRSAAIEKAERILRSAWPRGVRGLRRRYVRHVANITAVKSCRGSGHPHHHRFNRPVNRILLSRLSACL